MTWVNRLAINPLREETRCRRPQKPYGTHRTAGGDGSTTARRSLPDRHMVRVAGKSVYRSRSVSELVETSAGVEIGGDAERPHQIPIVQDTVRVDEHVGAPRHRGQVVPGEADRLARFVDQQATVTALRGRKRPAHQGAETDQVRSQACSKAVLASTPAGLRWSAPRLERPSRPLAQHRRCSQTRW